ncbi:hypothetical protein JCM31598_20380 [Desulfonatronum parangueonense]
MCQKVKIINGQRFTGVEFSTLERRELHSHAGAWERSKWKSSSPEGSFYSSVNQF